jgi:hypothetical protein
MLADERTRTVVHHEWALPAPAHWGDVDAALRVAALKHGQELGRATDIEYRCEDGTLVLGYTVDGKPASGRCEDEALCGDVERDRDEWERRPDNARTRLEYARQVLIKDGYFTADEVGDDIAPRLGEWLSHHRGRLDAAEAKIGRVAALARSWSQSRYIALKDPDASVRPLSEAADLVFDALADTEDGA